MKPKLAVVAGPENSATGKIMQSMIPHWKDSFEVSLFVDNTYDWPDAKFKDFDLVHFAWLGYASNEQIDMEIPITANVWQIGTLAHKYKGWLDVLTVDRIVVDDKVTRMQLGQLNYCKVIEVPLTTNLVKPPLLPFPSEFTVGYFGNNYKSKRFDVIEAAAKEAGVPLAGFGMKPERPVYLLDEKAIYEKMSVLIHASFHDTNSLVAMEAMQYGRPVIATWSPGLDRILTPWLNGLWFDGTVEHLTHQILEMQKGFYRYTRTVRDTIIPSTSFTAKRYEDMFKDVLDSN